MNKKRILLLLIILIPSLIYFLFELSEVNFKKMAYYGTRTVDAKGDTVYHTIPEKLTQFSELIVEKSADSVGNQILTSYLEKSPVQAGKAFLAILLKPGSEKKLEGLLEYEKYKENKFKDVRLVFVKPQYPNEDIDPGKAKYTLNFSEKYLRDSLGISSNSFHVAQISNALKEDDSKFDYSAYMLAYFNQKPIHVFDYFAVLVDKDRHIRGYYDPTYIAEVKRMIEEYKHLVLKDEHANMQNTNKIEQK